MTLIKKPHPALPISIHVQASNLLGELEEKVLPSVAKLIVPRYGLEPQRFYIGGSGRKLRLSFVLHNEEYQVQYEVKTSSNLLGIHLKSKLSISRDMGQKSSKSHNLSKWLGEDPDNLEPEDLIRDFEFLFAKIVDPLPPFLQKSFRKKAKGPTR